MRFSDPLYLLLLPPALAGLWLGFGHVHGMMRARKWLAFALRGILATLIIVALAGPEAHRRNEGVCTIFLLDRSDSVSDSDMKSAEGFVNECLKGMGTKDEAAVIAFGRNAMIDVAPGNLKHLSRVLSVVDRSGTDLAAAIRLASATFPDGKARRLVVLSDGNETAGDAVEAATVAAGDRIQVDNFPLGLTERAGEVSVASLEVPNEAREGQPFDLRVTVDSTVDADGLLLVDRDSVTIKKLPVRLSRGRNSLVASDMLNGPGFHRYRATVFARGDTDNRNNVGMGFVTVRGKPRLLLLQNDPSRRQLADALAQQGMAADLYGPDGVPVRPEQLQNYDAVVFNDINANTMTPQQMKLVQSAARDSGVGFAMIGGENSFLPGGYYNSPIADVLPVDLNVRQRKTFPSTSVLIVIDASGSMGAPEDGIEKIRIAAKGAQETVKLLAPFDRIGVAGDGEGLVEVAPMQPAADKGKIIAEIGKLEAGGGGIYITPSMEYAEKTLMKENSKVRHLIIMADGADCDMPEGGIPIALRMRRNHITTTVVSIGTGKDLQFLKDLARAGGGRFYLVQHANQLVSVFTQDTSVMARSAIEEGVFLPKVAGGSPILQGLASVPPLYAYCLASDRPLAQVDMRTHKDDPLLAYWQYGLATTLAFTSDAQPKWATKWVTWNGFGSFWAQALRFVSRRATLNDYQLTTRQDGGKAVVELRATDPSGNPINSLASRVSVTTPSGKAQDVNIVQQAPGTYIGSFGAAELGSYIVTVSEDSPAGKRVSTSGFSVPYPAEYRRYRANRPLLQRLSTLTHGVALAKPLDAFRPVLNPGFSVTPLWSLFMLLAAILLPFDVGARRVAVPVAQLMALLVGWLRALRARRAARPIAQVERVERLRKAKERVATPSANPAASPSPAPPPPPPTLPTPPAHPASEGSAGTRLLDAKRKRKDG